MNWENENNEKKGDELEHISIVTWMSKNNNYILLLDAILLNYY